MSSYPLEKSMGLGLYSATWMLIFMVNVGKYIMDAVGLIFRMSLTVGDKSDESFER